MSADGTFVVSTWLRRSSSYQLRCDLVAIDVATGDRRTIANAGEEADFVHPAISPDGTKVAAVRWAVGTPEHAVDQTLWLLDIESGEGADMTPDLDLWPGAPVWAPDGSAVYFVADEAGLAPVFRVDLDPRARSGHPADRGRLLLRRASPLQTARRSTPS